MAFTSENYDQYDRERRGRHRSAASDRSDFEVDKGRIVHSGAFRRLQGKTQVLGVGERDFYRTRLTHSLEVAQLGRGLCTEFPTDGFRPNADLVEAICLAHDIGHPPFGHRGEEFLHEKMRAFGGFGANPQNLRIVTLLETKYLDTGLDLTRATLDGLMKYPALYSGHERAKFTYSTEPGDKELHDWVKGPASIKTAVPLEAQIADWADQIAYSVNDIEDVVRAGLLDLVDMRNRAEEISQETNRELEKEAAKRCVPVDFVPSVTDAEAIAALAAQFQHDFAEPKEYRVRKANLKKWTSDTIKLLKENCRIISSTDRETTTDRKRGTGEPGEHKVSVRYRYRLTIGAEALARATVLQKTAEVLVFRDPRVTTLEAKGRHILNVLFDTFRSDATLLPLDFQEMISAGTFGSKERLVADFIAGMTDRYAYDYYKRLFQPGSGSFYEYV